MIAKDFILAKDNSPIGVKILRGNEILRDQSRDVINRDRVTPSVPVDYLRPTIRRTAGPIEGGREWLVESGGAGGHAAESYDQELVTERILGRQTRLGPIR